MRAVKILLVVIAVCFSLLSDCGWAQIPQPGTVVDSRLGSGLYVTHADDPTKNFTSARQSFLDLDLADAAVGIRQGAKRMREGLANVTDNSRLALQESITELESLARATEERSVKSVARLDEAFARANYALAQRHYLSALRAREEMAQARVGEELRRSAIYLQQARQHAGLQIRDQEAAVIDRTRTLGSNLASGISATSDEIAHEFRSLGQSLANMRDRISPRTAVRDEPSRR